MARVPSPPDPDALARQVSVLTRWATERARSDLVPRVESLAADPVGLAMLAVEVGAELERPVLAFAAREVARRLAEAYPGRVVELRVPPFTAVQLGRGDAAGAHRRGTPPNVVETDASTLLLLASGASTWAEELSSGNVQASGRHSDLSGIFPLDGPHSAAQYPGPRRTEGGSHGEAADS